MKKLPIGIQTFRKIIEKDLLYIDKTEAIYHFITNGDYYFLSRPRRFGKSLTLSTIEEIYQGNKSLFKGLWIEDQWNWEETHPVIHISFSSIGYGNLGLVQALNNVVDKLARDFEIILTNTSFDQKFKELIEQIGSKKKVVVLIDEYDKPLIDYLDDMDQAKANQKILKNFYAIFKDSDPYIQLLFITGVSKFSKVSIFSDLNNLRDITLSRDSAKLVGYTEAEMHTYFDDYLELAATENDTTKEALFQQIKQWYNGYSWDTKQYVYNPFSVLSYFADRKFRNFWFATGTPTFLIKILHDKMFYNFENVETGNSTFESYSLDNLETVSLLFQTGYLTIKNIDEFGIYTLGFPNKEVKESMLQHLVGSFRFGASSESAPLVTKLRKAFFNHKIEDAISIINTIFKSIPSHIFLAKKEAYYHSLIHLTFTFLGLFLESEVHTSDGRIDAVVKTPSHIYILEFKLDKSAAEAMDQIKNKAYHKRFLHQGKIVVGIGINFSSKTKMVDGWLIKDFESSSSAIK